MSLDAGGRLSGFNTLDRQFKTANDTIGGKSNLLQ